MDSESAPTPATCAALFLRLIYSFNKFPVVLLG